MQKILYYFSILCLLTVFGCKDDETNNPCGEINCQNGGKCENGICDCPPHFTGADCGQQITPIEIRINKIEVIQWPSQTPDGEDWDKGFCIGPLPDIFAILRDDQEELLSTAFVSESREDSIYTYQDSFPVLTTNISSELNISLFDRDTGLCLPSDSMGTVQAPLYFPTNDFPSILELSSDDPPIKVKVFVEYEF